MFWKRIFVWFVRITGILPFWLFFKTKVFFENKKKQSTKIKGGAILVSNHNSVWDVAPVLFVFWRRIPRCLTAELMYKKNAFFPFFLNSLACIKVDRDSHDYSFMEKCCKILKEGGLVEVYPESRIPQPGEETPLPFKPSTIVMALESGAPIIPMYNDGVYFTSKRNHIIIGTPFYARDYYDESLSERENVEMITEKLRNRIIELRDELSRQESKKD